MENQQFSPNPGQIPLPNASAVMIMGILSIVGCFCYGVLGIVFGIIALVLYNKDKALYNANPGMYSAQSLSSLNTGRICALIGLIPSALFFLVWVFIIIMSGIGALADPSHFMDHFQR